MFKHLFKLLYEVDDKIVCVLTTAESARLSDARKKVESANPRFKTLASYDYLGIEQEVIFVD